MNTSLTWSGSAVLSVAWATALADAAAKTVLLLLAAALLAVALRRTSAATLHLIWLAALSGCLLLPALSLVAPRWQVLPAWLPWARPTATTAIGPHVLPDPGSPGRPRVEATESIKSSESTARSAAVASLASIPTDQSQLAAVLPSDVPSRTVPWATLALAAWGVGVSVCLARLVRSTWALRALSRRMVEVTSGPLCERLRSAAAQMNVAVPRLHLGEPQAMPMVWGCGRGRLLLPSTAPAWEDGRCRSVLLHELAHLSRRDPLTLSVGHLACAVHWFNPLAWIALSQLRAAQEAACDDAVLRQGIKASHYALDLVSVAARLRAAPATALALAMARSHDLEGRVQTILDAARNRRAVTRRMVALIVLAGSCLTGGLALVSAADSPGQSELPKDSAGEQAQPATGQFETGESKVAEPTAASAKDYLAAIEALRGPDGRFGADALASLRTRLEAHLKNHPAWPDAAAAAAWLERTAGDQTWSRAELISLLEEGAAWSDPVVAWAALAAEFAAMDRVKKGQDATPEELADLAFGPPADNGLQVAWAFGPAQPAYAVGDVLTCRVVFRNGGDKPVQFVTETWHQYDTWRLRNAATGVEIPVEGVRFSGMTPHHRYLLLPGQIAEVTAPGVAIGKGDYAEEFSTGKIGKVLAVQVGDELEIEWTVRLPGFELKDGDGNVRVPGEQDWTGTLESGTVRFRVTAPDPDAPARLGVATAPGRYKLAERIRVQVSRTSHPDGRYSNTATILWQESDDADSAVSARHSIDLPDGLDTFGLAWERGANVLWIAERAFWRRVVWTTPADVREERVDHAVDADLTDPTGGDRGAPGPRIREALGKFLERSAPDDNQVPPSVPNPAKGSAPPTPNSAETPEGLHSIHQAGSHELGQGRTLVIDQPPDAPPTFTIRWPGEAGRPACERTIPLDVGAGQGEGWGLVWIEGEDHLWWVDKAAVGKILFGNPAQIIETMEGRKNNFSRDFGLSPEIKTALGAFAEVGRKGLLIGGNVGGQRITSAVTVEPWIVTGVVRDGNQAPLEGAEVQAISEYQAQVPLGTIRTDSRGQFELRIRADLETLSKFRGVEITAKSEGRQLRGTTALGGFALETGTTFDELASQTTSAKRPGLRPNEPVQMELTLQ